jgi:hypothetical protein
MRSSIAQISFMFFALILNLAWANSRFDEVAFFQHTISSCNDRQDTSDPVDYLHSNCCEDDVYSNDSIIKSSSVDVMNNKVHSLKDIIQNEYLSKIWQPPKKFF